MSLGCRDGQGQSRVPEGQRWTEMSGRQGRRPLSEGRGHQ